jgi:hypothetical protein
VADLEPLENVAIGAASIARPVVGQHSLDSDPDVGKSGGGQLEFPSGAFAALVGDRHDHDVSAGVVD